VVEQVKQPDSFGRHCMITTNHFGISAKKKQTISFAGGTNLNITNAWLTANGWDGKSSVTLINTAQIISSTTATAALIISATMPQGRTLVFVNNGGVYGLGGAGLPSQGVGASGIVGNYGGTALTAQSSVKIINNSNIAGGGGSGALPAFGTGMTSGKGADHTGSGGTGGNGTSTGIGGGTPTNGYSGQNSYGANNQGSGGYNNGQGNQAGAGGGGSFGSYGGNSGSYSAAGYTSPIAGGAGGAAVTGNANIIWVLTGNRYGAIS
jgi:hypothetical protein